MKQHRITVPLSVKSKTKATIEGHGSVFNNVDLGSDIVVPGAFASSLKRHEAAGTTPLMLWQHDIHQPIGKWDQLSEDDYGLKVKGRIADTQLGNDVRELVKMDAIRGLSIGFFIEDSEFDGPVQRIKQVDLVEVSIVSLAMNPLAQIEYAKARASAQGEYVPTKTEFERVLRDAGASRMISQAITSKVYTGIGPRDADEPEIEDLESLREKLQLATLRSKINV